MAEHYREDLTLTPSHCPREELDSEDLVISMEQGNDSQNDLKY